MLQLFIAEVLIGSVGVFAHEGGQDPITTVFFRCVFGSAFLLAWGIARGQLRGVFGDSALLRAAVLSGVLLVLNWVALFAGMARSSIGVATLVYHFFPFAMIVIAAVFFGERAHAADLAWTALAFVGVACAADPLKLFAGAGADYALGIALTFVAAILCGASLLLSRRISRERPLLVVLVQCLAGVAMLEASGLGRVTCHHPVPYPRYSVDDCKGGYARGPRPGPVCRLPSSLLELGRNSAAAGSARSIPFFK